jgi:hypothetical protein
MKINGIMLKIWCDGEVNIFNEPGRYVVILYSREAEAKRQDVIYSMRTKPFLTRSPKVYVHA